jgi:GH25 family lysozyme M1 (1,4-beta-N-acetylmuramidase)
MEEFMNIKLQRKMTKIKALLMVLALVLPLVLPGITANAAATETAQAAIGIDVSRFQGLIDWNQVAASGVSFAMIRVGNRPNDTGVIVEDVYARYNLQEANRVGIKVGVYFNSTATTEAEAIEEANFTINLISKYKITFPVAYDCENYNKATSRQYGLGSDVRTVLAVKFLDTVAAAGYTPMFYASKNAMTDSADWNMSVLNNYKVWVAQYPSQPFPATVATSYTGIYSMWQYSEKGTIAGIGGAVDMSVSYFYYDGINDAKDSTGTALISAENAANIIFTPVSQVVTPSKNELNIRTVPDSSDDATIVIKLNPGDMIIRAGIGNNGWSQLIINGQIYYASSSYLTKVL